MSELRRQLGSLIVCGFDNAVLPANLNSLLEQGSLGGIILFARNYVSSSKLTSLTKTISAVSNGRAFIAVDQEGGRVVRFDGDFPVFPSPLHFGKRNDLEGFSNGTSVTAKALRTHGVNLNLVPVCDLDPEDSTHVLHSRAFSHDVKIASDCAKAQVEVLKANNVISCAKHFPGLASATGDPHFQVSFSARTLEEFRKSDYEPFRAAIAAGVDMIMPTHLRSPALDENNIVTFSHKVLQNELRGHLGFTGLIISDDLQMLGALEGVSQIEAGKLALAAGCDLLIYANLQDTIESLLDGLEACATADDKLRERISESYQRVVAFQNNNPQYFSA